MPEQDLVLSDEHLGNTLTVEDIPFVDDVRLYMRVDAIRVTREQLLAFARAVLERYGP